MHSLHIHQSLNLQLNDVSHVAEGYAIFKCDKTSDIGLF